MLVKRQHLHPGNIVYMRIKKKNFQYVNKNKLDD